MKSKRANTFAKMMASIKSSHSIGNTIRMVKLPLILTNTRLYADAISQFYWLTKTLEECLEAKAEDGLLKSVRALKLKVTPGYESDLKELYGTEWLRCARMARTSATESYCSRISNAPALELVAASFILYGALVIGGGKSTQEKVRRVFPSCKHKLFDVADDMKALRKQFRGVFNGIGASLDTSAEEKLIGHAAAYMKLNNTVILSVRCVSYWVWGGVALSAALITAAAVRYYRRPS